MQVAIRKSVLLLLLALVNSGAMAAWVRIGASETDTLYVDPATIRYGDNTAKIWALNDFTETQRRDERGPFKSEKVEYEYDCKAQQARLLYFTSHAESMAGGDIVDFNVAPGEWMRIAPGSELEALWEIACWKA